MFTKRQFVTISVLTCLCSPVFADNHLIETRYCGEPPRNANGEIVRSAAVRREFERLHPLPAGVDRAGYAKDHVLPMASGGCDSVSNMQWLKKITKSCAEDYCKDRYERIIYPELN